jgi:hypothetical protein
VARYVFLDTGPLGLAGKPRGKPDADRRLDWLLAIEKTGSRVVIPEIADYEVRRELIRAGATAGIKRLDLLLARFALLLLDRPALLKAADLWALVRNAGVTTADPHALDGDAILAGQVLSAIKEGDSAVVATGNARHLTRFPGIDAQPWESII